MTIKKQVKRFWKIFLQEQKNLERALEENNKVEIDEISKILGTYFEELCNCELELGVSDQFYELTFLSNGEKNAQLVSILLKDMTPDPLKERWIVNACMPPLSEKALNTVLRIKEQEYAPESFNVYYEVDEANKCLNVKIFCQAFQHLEPNKAFEIGTYMLQLFIGECALEAYINSIEVIDEPEVEDHCILPEFYEVLLDIVMEKVWAQYADPTLIYRVYQVREEITSLEVRKDMKMIFTTHPILISEVLENNYVSYHEFFDFGGEFGYIYYEQEKGDGDEAFLRQQLEKKLQELLYPLGIAKNIGGAIGLKYSYIDLAIYDKEEFLEAFAKIKEKLSIPLLYQTFE